MSEKEQAPVVAVPIHPIFHSFTTGRPLEHCVMCERNLLTGGANYLVEKAFRKYKDYRAQDVIFEYAICLDCAEKMRKELSKESLQRINDYFNQHVDLEERHRKMYAEAGSDPKHWLDKCMITGTPAGELEEYQVVAHCAGNQMLLYHFPYLISGQAMEELSDLLSEKTREVLDDFMDKHFGLPPELNELVKGRRLIFI